MTKILLASLAVISAVVLKGKDATVRVGSMQSTRVFGQTIRYYDVGSGPVLVLLHGLASTAFGDWGKVIETLAATHRVLAMDQIGFGSSDKPTVEYRVQTYVDFLGEFLRQQKIHHFSLAGISFGGWIAAQYAIQALQPENSTNVAGKLPIPDKLLLCDAGGLHQDLSPEAILPLMLPGSVAAQKASAAALLYNRSLATDEAARNLFISRLAANDGATVRSLVNSVPTSTEWLDGKLNAITIPTLIVWGVEDPLFPIAHGRALAAGIPDAKLVTIEKCGHVPTNEKPNEFLAAVKDFLP
jgi:pimeloyl-ACP methyl ester carboxylesterase